MVKHKAADMTLSGIIVVGVIVAAVALAPSRPPSPRLVGYGCDGASGKLYADEESDFPSCVAIEPVAGSQPLERVK